MSLSGHSGYWKSQTTPEYPRIIFGKKPIFLVTQLHAMEIHMRLASLWDNFNFLTSIATELDVSDRNVESEAEIHRTHPFLRSRGWDFLWDCLGYMFVGDCIHKNHAAIVGKSLQVANKKNLQFELFLIIRNLEVGKGFAWGVSLRGKPPVFIWATKKRNFAVSPQMFKLPRNKNKSHHERIHQLTTK